MGITGGDGADNQRSPDEVAVGDTDRAALVWHYGDGAGAGVGAEVCVPYRALFFAFGFEAIAERTQRAEVMGRSLDWLVTSPAAAGLALEYESETRIAPPGATLTHTLRVRHVGQAGPPDTLTVALEPGIWMAALTPTHFTLEPCESRYVTVTLSIPPEAGINVRDQTTVTLSSALVPTPTVALLTAKTPAAVLLVKDDRWYPMEDYYRQALAARGVPFDLWSTDHANTRGLHRGPVTAELLRPYSVVVWFTGYDWYAPVTPVEAALLLDYLDGGGRLLLSSQDYLYYHSERLLTERLGVLEATGDVGVSTAFGVTEHPAGGNWGPAVLSYPFNNWSDRVEPRPEVAVVARGEGGAPVALGAEGAGDPASRTLFYAFPIETLPEAARAEVLAAGIGWLSPLGRSAWSVLPEAPLPGAPVTATLVLHNDGPEARVVSITHTLPEGLSLIEATLSPELDYDPIGRHIGWGGWITPSLPLTLSWSALLDPLWPGGGALTPTVRIELPDWGWGFERRAALRGGGGTLADSYWLIPPEVEVQRPLTVSLALVNSGPGAVEAASVALWLQAGLAPITATQPEVGLRLPLWEGSLVPGETRVLTLPLRPWRYAPPLRVDALLSDGTGRRWERSLWLEVASRRAYLPMVLKTP